MYGILAAALFALAAYCYTIRYRTADADALVEVTGVIGHPAVIDAGGKGHKYAHIELREYPDFTFSIKRVQALRSGDYLRGVAAGDTLTLTVGRRDYAAKLARTEAPGFMMRSVNYRFIGIYVLRYKKNSYLSLGDLDERHTDDCLLWALVLAGFGVACLYLMCKTKNNKK